VGDVLFFIFATYLVPLGAIVAAIVVAYGYRKKRMSRAVAVAAVLWLVPWLLALFDHMLGDVITIAFTPASSGAVVPLGPVWISPLIGLGIVFFAVHHWLRTIRSQVTSKGDPQVRKSH
jgi:hypothetical protein